MIKFKPPPPPPWPQDDTRYDALAEAVAAWNALDIRAEQMRQNNQVPSREFARQISDARREMLRLAGAGNPCPNCGDPLNAMGRCAKCMAEFVRRNA